MSPAILILATLLFALCYGIRWFGAPAAVMTLPVSAHMLSALLT